MIFFRTHSTLHHDLPRYRWTAQLTGGSVMCFYGGNFTHLFLCAAAYKSAEGANVVKNFQDLVDVGRDSHQKFKSQLGEDGVLISVNDNVNNNAATSDATDKAAPVAVPTNTVLAALQCIDPVKITTCVRSMYSGFLVALCAAMNANAAKFGLGLELGNRISNFLMGVADKLIARAEKKLEDSENNSGSKSTTASSSAAASPTDNSENQLAAPGPGSAPAWAWTKLGVRTLCTSLGVMISWKLKDAAVVGVVISWKLKDAAVVGW